MFVRLGEKYNIFSGVEAPYLIRNVAYYLVNDNATFCATIIRHVHNVHYINGYKKSPYSCQAGLVLVSVKNSQQIKFSCHF